VREDEYDEDYVDHDEDWREHDPDAYRDDATRTRRARGCLPVLFVLLVLGAVAWFGGRYAYDEISSRLGPAPDFAGPGSGAVLYEVQDGATSADIGRELKAKGVVKSVDAFNDAARADDRSRNIQVGYYQLKERMKAADALAVLVDPENLIQNLVVVPEGARVRQVVDTIVDETDISRKAVTAALADPKAIGLPAEAAGNPEGYLFPATYTVPPNQDAVGLIRQMVAKSVEVEESLDVAARAEKVNLTPKQVLTVASILEYEVNRSEDYPKVARVIYNRLNQGMPLQMDSTVAYVSKRSGDVWTTAAERSNTSAYNTYANTGLPPGPIGSPGEETIEAALTPAKGDWLYFVADYEADTTRFSVTYKEHLKWVAKLRAYCRESEDC
jgi:UPF0755 protein